MKDDNSIKNDTICTTKMVRHRDKNKIMSGFMLYRKHSDMVFIEGSKYENGELKRFTTDDMTMDEFEDNWIIVEDLCENDKPK